MSQDFFTAQRLKYCTLPYWEDKLFLPLTAKLSIAIVITYASALVR